MVQWWLIIAGTGLALGGITAATHEVVRVFTKTLGAPLALLLLRVALPQRLHGANNPLPILLEYLLLVLAAFMGDYLIGRRLGKSDALGYREETVGH